MKALFSRTTFGTMLVCSLILLFALLAVYSAGTIASQIEQMYRHPYTVRAATQDMRTRLLEVRLYLLPKALAADKAKGEELYKLLSKRKIAQDNSLAVVRRFYLGPPEDVAALAKALDDERDAWRRAIRDCTGLPEEETAVYLLAYVEPYSILVDAALSRLMRFIDKRVKLFRDDAEFARDLTVLGALVLCMLLIALVLFIADNERKKNRDIAYREQLFNQLSKSIADVFFVYDHTAGRLEYVSENCFRMLGITAREFYEDSGVMQRHLAPEAAAELEALLVEAARGEAGERDFVFQRDHRTLDLKLRAYPILGIRKMNRSIAMLTDQTELISRQAVLRDALLNVRKANEAKQEFLSRMSHEIRTPMNAIIGMTTIATKHLGSQERIADCLEKISISSKHLLSLINDVLDISKIEGGKFTFSHGPFVFQEFINTLTAIIYPQTVAHQQKFEITVSGLNEETLIGDELRLRQVLINLLSNAIKFTPAGGEIRLDVSLLPRSGEDVVVRFVVSDTGIGMNEEFLKRLYTPFTQADNIAQHYGGTGLGLSITQNLVSLMSGSIGVKSEEGKGTTFSLELPFGLLEAYDGSPRVLAFNDITVLVVDDDLTTCEHAVLLLEQIGVHGHWTTSGADAVEKVVQARKTEEPYSVCLIDWLMPDMNGLETARLLRKKIGKDTPIIIISSYDWSSIEQEAREVGVNGFIAKPLFTSSLYNTLARVCFSETPETKAARQDEDYDFTGKKVLLAEDNPLNQEIALELLQSVDLRVDCANDGQKALDMFQNSSPGEYALILMDVQMPRMDGYAATKAIRASPRPDAAGIPILAMTANAFNSDIHAAREAGMNGHLAKPIDVDVLFRTIAEHIGR